MNLNQKKRIDFYLGSVLMMLLRPVVRVLGRGLRRDHDPVVRGDLACVKMMGGGSLVIALPSLCGLRRKYPHAKFKLVTTPAVRPFAELIGIFDEIIVIDDSSFMSAIIGAVLAWRDCWRVDTVIDLEVYSRLSGIFSLLTCARNRIGFYFEDIFLRKFIYTHLLYLNRFSPIHVFYEQNAHLLGATPVPPTEAAAALEINVTARRTDVKTICIGAGCSDFGKERMLTAEQWVQVINTRVRSVPAHIVFLGSKSDAELAEAIIHAAGGDQSIHTFNNMCGRLSLRESVSMLWGSDEYWGIDSGLLHFARLGRIPTVSFWGPTAPNTRLQKIDGLIEEIIYRPIPCSPCIHVADTSPCHGNNICIKNLFKPEVAVSSEDLLFTKWPPANEH
jgi:ADP-heptose:LPS heptosyltransferase